MMLGALPSDVGMKTAMKLELDPRDPTRFKYDTL